MWYNSISQEEHRLTIRGKCRKENKMDQNMTSKEFTLLISMMLKMLKNGQVEEVIELLEEAIKKDTDK